MTSGAQTASLVPLTKMATTFLRRAMRGTESSATSPQPFLGNSPSQCTYLEIGWKIHSCKIASTRSNFCAHQKHSKLCLNSPLNYTGQDGRFEFLHFLVPTKHLDTGHPLEFNKEMFFRSLFSIMTSESIFT